MAKVDVIIPAYNAAKYLPTAIESVIAQTFNDWRILIVDDGSTDGTADAAAPYLERLGSRLVYIRKANGGVSSARNLGICQATAQYLAMLDADDEWMPCRLSESLQILDSRPEVGLTYGFIRRIDAQGRLIDTVNRRQRRGEGRIARYIYTKEVDIPCATVTVRRSCLDEVGLFDETLKVTEDRDLWLRLALQYEIALVPFIVANYRISNESITAVPDRMLQAQKQFIEKNYGAEGCGWLARRIALGRVYKQRADSLSAQQHPWKAAKCSLRALMLNPFDLGNVRAAGSLLNRWARFRP